jgi:hypothetical protein
MGEIIRKMADMTIAGGDFMVELNHPSGKTQEREIHIQNDKIRLALSERDFYRMGACLLLARRQLEMIKNGGQSFGEQMEKTGE